MKLIKYFALALAMVAMVACGGDSDGNKTSSSKSKVTLKASNYSVTIGTPITFTVIDAEGRDLTADAVIFDKTNEYDIVTNPFTPEADGEYIFFASVNSQNTPYITIDVVPTIPELPVDPKPANTSFYHRILLIDHTGNTCGYCPNMMEALKMVYNISIYT